jgi:hypothetical protein
LRCQFLIRKYISIRQDPDPHDLKVGTGSGQKFSQSSRLLWWQNQQNFYLLAEQFCKVVWLVCRKFLSLSYVTQKKVPAEVIIAARYKIGKKIANGAFGQLRSTSTLNRFFKANFISALWHSGCRFDKHNSLMTNFAFSKKFMKHSCQPYSKILFHFLFNKF